MTRSSRAPAQTRLSWTLPDQLPTFEGGEDGEAETDPHWWQGPTNAILAVEAIRDQFSAVEPGGTNTYDANADAYIARLTAKVGGSTTHCWTRRPF